MKIAFAAAVATIALAAFAAEPAGGVIEPRFEIRTVDASANPGPESLAVADLNNDGKLDLISAGNWYEALGWVKHRIRDVPVTNGYVDSFSDLPLDVDGDGFVDVIQIGYFARRIVWMKNPGRGGGDWTENLIDAVGPTEFAFLVDLDNDGQARELLPQFTAAANAPLCWYEFIDGKPVKHVVSDRSYGHGIGVGDLNGDHRNDILTPIGWLEAPADPRAPGNWIFHPQPWNRRPGVPAVVAPAVAKTPTSAPTQAVAPSELERAAAGAAVLTGPVRRFGTGAVAGSVAAVTPVTAGPPVAGLAIELIDGARKETVYLDANLLPVIQQALAEIADTEARNPIPRGTMSYFGSGVFWARPGGVPPLNVAFYKRGEAESGLALGKAKDPGDAASGPGWFYFPGLRTADFAALVAAATKDLAAFPAAAASPSPAPAPAASVPPVRPLEFGYMHLLDVNADGRKDIVATDGHNYGIYWLEQRIDGTWLLHEIDRRFSESHASVLVDFNGDGQPDLVTGKRFQARNQNDPGVAEPLGIYWYEFRRGGNNAVEWIRHPISEGGQMGTGLQLVVVDLDGDGDLDVVAPGKSGLFIAERK